MTITTAKWSLDDYHRMVDVGILQQRHVELLHGEIIEMPPEGPIHADLSGDAADYLRQKLGSRVKVREAKPMTLPNASEPEPDIAIVQPILYREHHPYPEQVLWVIEFANTSLAKDRDVKRKIYAEAGIPEYWRVNLNASELTVWRYERHPGNSAPQSNDYQFKQTFTQGTIRPVSFPEISFSVEYFLT